jgi:hypothetical protein
VTSHSDHDEPFGSVGFNGKHFVQLISEAGADQEQDHEQDYSDARSVTKRYFTSLFSIRS